MVYKRQRGRRQVELQLLRQQGEGLKAAIRILPQLLRKLGPQLSRLTRGVRRTAPKVARGLRKSGKKLATKKNLKRVGKTAAIAAGTVAISGAAQHGVRKLLSKKSEE